VRVEDRLEAVALRSAGQAEQPGADPPSPDRQQDDGEEQDGDRRE